MNAVQIRRLFPRNTIKFRRPQNLQTYRRVREAFNNLGDLLERNAPLDEIQGATEYLLDVIREQGRSH